MAAKLMLAGMLAGVVSIGAMAASWPEHEPESEPPRAQPQDGWLSREAAAEIFGGPGNLGPLFAGMWPGSTAPSREARTRIAEFARANNVEIDLEIERDELVAIRFAVTFGGCCGYEGVDVLSLGLGRPHTSECCGCTRELVDDWAFAGDDGVHMRASARVNRLKVRWERALTVPEIVERANSLVGKRETEVARTAGDRWRRLEPGRYLLEVPYPFARFLDIGPNASLRNRVDLGMMVRVEHGIVVEVSAELRDIDREIVTTAAKRRWGWPRVTEDAWIWHRSDRIVTSTHEYVYGPSRLTIVAR